MFPSAGDELAVKPAGLVVAAVGFALTRGFTAGIAAGSGSIWVTVPLAVGLGTVVYGISLSVSTHGRGYARTVALWYLLGTASAASVVAAGSGMIQLGALPTAMTDAGVVSAGVGGGGLGILVGIRTGRSQRQRRHLDQQSHQVTLFQRLLRHEVLNGLTAIRGHASLLADDSGADRSLTAVESNVDRIQRKVDDVGYLARTVDDTLAALGTVDLADVVYQCRERLPDGGDRVVVDSIPSVMVRSDDHLDTVVAELVTTALNRTDDEVLLDVTPGEETVELTVTAAGDWLTDVEQTVLLEGLPEYDRPDIGYGISIVRLLVGRYGGSLVVSTTAERTTVTVELLQTIEDSPPGESLGVAPTDLSDAAVAGLGAGLAMGALLQVFTGQVAVIGSLYGVRSLPVGWVAHLFHSVLFSTVAVVTIRQTRLAWVVANPRELVATGVGYGLALWLVGASLLMPAWLTAVGASAPIPNLQPVSLVAHLVWGMWLGASLTLLLPDSPP